jgi:hypothetical protein
MPVMDTSPQRVVIMWKTAGDGNTVRTGYAGGKLVRLTPLGFNGYGWDRRLAESGH